MKIADLLNYNLIASSSVIACILFLASCEEKKSEAIKPKEATTTGTGTGSETEGEGETGEGEEGEGEAGEGESREGGVGVLRFPAHQPLHENIRRRGQEED